MPTTKQPETNARTQKIIDEMFQAGLLGTDPNLKLQKLNRARKIAIAVSATGVTLGITFMFIPPLYLTSMIIKTLCFWVGLAMVVFSNGLYTIKPKSDDPHPSVFYGMFWPSIMLAWNAFRQNPPLKNYAALFVSCLILGIALIFLLRYCDKLLKNKTSLNVVLFLMLTFPYSYGLISFYNHKLDTSQPQTSKVTIQTINNSILGRKNILVQSDENKMIQFSFSDDQNLLDENKVYILEEHQGLFQFPWYNIVATTKSDYQIKNNEPSK